MTQAQLLPTKAQLLARDRAHLIPPQHGRVGADRDTTAGDGPLVCQRDACRTIGTTALGGTGGSRGRARGGCGLVLAGVVASGGAARRARQHRPGRLRQYDGL
jgi:hypothetical protein